MQIDVVESLRQVIREMKWKEPRCQCQCKCKEIVKRVPIKGSQPVKYYYKLKGEDLTKELRDVAYPVRKSAFCYWCNKRRELGDYEHGISRSEEVSEED